MCFPSGQKSSIVHTADAHGGFPPSSAAAAVPLWRFIDLHTSWAAVSAGPFFCLPSYPDRHPVACKPMRFAGRRVSRRNERQAREKRRKRELNRSQSSPPVAADAQPPPPHRGHSSFAGLSAPLVLRGSNARPQLHPAARSAVREVSSKRMKTREGQAEGRVQSPGRSIPCNS